MEWSIWTQNNFQLSYFAWCFPKLEKLAVPVRWNYNLRKSSENMLVLIYSFVLVVLAFLVPEGQGKIFLQLCLTYSLRTFQSFPTYYFFILFNENHWILKYPLICTQPKWPSLFKWKPYKAVKLFRSLNETLYLFKTIKIAFSGHL